MELLYVWIKEFRNIVNQEYNFNPAYKISFNEEELTIEKQKNKEIPRQFFGENILSVTAIIGKNGSGKTSFFDFLLSNIKDRKSFIIVYKHTNVNGDAFTILTQNDIIKKLYKLKKKWLIYHHNYDDIFYQEKISSCLIRMSNSFSPINNPLSKDQDDGIGFFDLSISYKLSSNSYSSKDVVKEYKEQILKNVQEFLLEHKDNKELIEVLDFIPKSGFNKINISDHQDFGSNEIFIKVLKDDKGNKLSKEDKFIVIFLSVLYGRIKHKKLMHLREKLNNDIGKEEEKEPWEELERLNKLSREEILRRKLSHRIVKLREKEERFEGEKKRCNIEIDYYEEQLNELKKLMSDDLLNPTYSAFEGKSLIEILSMFDKKSFIEILRDTEYTKKSTLVDFFEILFEIADNLELETEHLSFSFTTEVDNLKRFEKKYSKLLQEFRLSHFLDYDWGLSSGELAMVSRFALLFNKKEKFENYDTLIIMLDEVDLYLHPEWSRKNIYYLIELLPKIFKQKIQIILTTHSPFVVSDLPKESVILLDIDKETRLSKSLPLSEKTFSSNIHQLFKNEFYLEHTIGQFATKKINEIMLFYHEIKSAHYGNQTDKLQGMAKVYSEKKTYFEYVINCIGEQYIKSILKNNIEEIETVIKRIKNDKN